MKKLKEEKRCDNCRYYLQHYVKFNTSFISTFCGHCVNLALSTKERNKCKFCYVCEHWETCEPLKAKRVQDIKSAIRQIADSLDTMAAILVEEQQ